VLHPQSLSAGEVAVAMPAWGSPSRGGHLAGPTDRRKAGLEWCEVTRPFTPPSSRIVSTPATARLVEVETDLPTQSPGRCSGRRKLQVVQFHFCAHRHGLDRGGGFCVSFRDGFGLYPTDHVLTFCICRPGRRAELFARIVEGGWFDGKIHSYL
jgi:hypothetical protein